MRNTAEQIEAIANVKGEAARLALTDHAQRHSSYEELNGEAKTAMGGLITMDHNFFQEHPGTYEDHAQGEWTSFEDDQAAAGLQGVKVI